MRRLLLFLALVCWADWSAAQSIGGGFIQYYPPAGSGTAWDGGAFSAAAEGPTGCAAPAYSFTADTNAGLCLGAANDFTIQTAASGNSRSYVRGTTSVLSNYFVDAGGNVTGWDLGDEAVLSVNSSQLLRFGDTLGSGFLVGKGGATAAVVRSIAAGPGVSVSNGDGQSGNPTASVDTATTPQFSSGTGLPAGTCTVGQTYLETDVPRSCECSATNTWVCSSQTRTHATDCTALTDGLTNDLCWELDSERAFLCQPTAGGCDTAGEWIAQTVSAAQISSGDVAFSQIAQASGASVLVGRGSAGGAGDFQEITLGSGLSMSGTALSASGGSGVPRPLTKRWFMCNADNGGLIQTSASCGSSGSPSGAEPTASDGYLTTYTSAGGAGSIGQVYSYNHLARVGRSNYFEFYGGISSTAEQRTIIGLHQSGTGDWTGSDDPAKNHATFRCSSVASDTNWQCVTNDGTSGGTINNSGVTCDTSTHKFSITENNGTSFVFAIDGSTVCTNSANLPTSGTNLLLNAGIISTAAATKGIAVGVIYLETDK